MTHATASRSPSLMRASAAMASGSLVSRILGVVRTSMLLAIFSNTTAGDTWQVANAIPNMLYLLLAGGVLNAVLVPQITKAEAAGADGRRYVDTLLSLAILAMAVITAVCLPLAPFLVRMFASSATWDAEAFRLSTEFAVLVLPAVFFYGLYTILGQVLNARSRFGWYMWAPVLCNVVWIIGLIAYHVSFAGLGREVAHWSPEMVRLIGGTMTLGVAAQALVLLVPLWRDGFRLRPRFALRGIGLGSAGTVAAWTFAAVAVAQLGVVVLSRVLTSVESGFAGKIGYDTAYMLFITPHGLITVSLVTALFTGMAKSAHRDDLRAVRSDVRRGLRLIAVTTIPIVLLTLSLGPAAIRLVFPANTLQATDAITYVTWCLIVGLPWYGAFYLVQRAFYAFEDAKTPFWLQVVGTGVGTAVALASLLVPSAFRAVGVGLGQTLALVGTAVVALVWLRRRLGGLALYDVIRTAVRVLVASMPAAVAGYAIFLLFQTMPGGHAGAAAGLVLGVPVFALLYVLAARRMHVREVDELLRPVLARWPRFLARPGPSV